MRNFLAALAALFTLITTPLAAQTVDEKPTPEVQAFLDSLHPEGGVVRLPAAKATLDLGDKYLFYGPEDAKRVLVDLWGNPPDSADGVLGLVMPADKSPATDSWGAVVTYEDTGHVSDDDAGDTDYAAILSELQQNSASSNEARKAAGYATVQVVGWAEQPKYDASTHSVVWARDIAFSGQDVDSLNYDMRQLGREGVLSINFVSIMPELASVRQAATDFASHAHFDPGSRYEDFDSSTDRMADYGIGGLVAAGVGVAAAKKLGLLAILLKFIKPILIGVAVFFAAIWSRIKRLFGMGDAGGNEDWADYPDPGNDDPDDPGGS